MTNTENRNKAIWDFFEDHDSERIRNYFDEVLHGYITSEAAYEGLELANLHWFMVETVQFLTQLEPLELKKRRLEELEKGLQTIK